MKRFFRVLTLMLVTAVLCATLSACRQSEQMSTVEPSGQTSAGEEQTEQASIAPEPIETAEVSSSSPEPVSFGSEKLNQLIETMREQESPRDTWWPSAIKILKNHDPAVRNNDTVFYGASNFERWSTMEIDLAPYAVQNHAFGGSTDKDLVHWAQYLLYPYQPKYVFFQTGSNDYAQSKAETDELKIAEAMDFKKEMFSIFHEQLPDAKFIVMSGILLPGRSEYVAMTLEINDQLKAFCEETDYMIYIDAESLTYDRASGSFVDNVESLFVDDLIHLTGDARITWAQNWIIPMLENLEAPKAEQ